MKKVLPLLFISPILAWAQQPKLLVPTGHSAAITCVAYSPEGQYLFTGSMDKSVKMWEADGTLIRTFIGHEASITGIIAGPNRHYLITRSQHKSILWSINGTHLLSFESRDDPLFSPDGQYLLYQAIGTEAVLYHIAEKRRTSLVNNNGKALQFWPSGQQVITQHEDTIWLTSFAGQDQKALARVKFKEERLRITGAPNQDFFVIGYSNGVVDRLDVPSGTITALIEQPAKQLRVLSWTSSPARSRITHPSEWVNLVVSPDSKYLFLGTFHSIRLLDLVTKETVFEKDYAANLPDTINTYRLPGKVAPEHPLYVSHDNRYLLTRTYLNLNINLWDITGNKKSTFGYLDGAELRKEIKGELEIQVSRGGTSSLPVVAFSPVDDHLLVGYSSGHAVIWDRNGQLIRTLGAGSINKVHTVEQGNTAETELSIVRFRQNVTASGPFQISKEDNGVKTRFDLTNHLIKSIEPVPIGHSRIRSAYDLATHISSADEQYTIHTKANAQAVPIFFGTPVNNPSDGVVLIASKEKPPIAFQPYHSVSDVAFSGNNQYLLVAPSYDAPTYYDFPCLLTNNTPIETSNRGLEANVKIAENCGPKTLDHLPQRPYFFDFSTKQEGRFLLSDRKEKLYLANVNDRDTQTYFGHRLGIIGATFLQDERFIVSWSHDHTIKIWETISGRELATIVFLGEREWAVTTPSGLFDASAGAMSLMYYVAGLEVIELDQLKARYYEPGLLQKLIGLSDEPITPVEKLSAVTLYPKVSAEIDADNTLRIQLTERNGGIGKTSVFVNGKEILEDANPNRGSSFLVDLNLYQRFRFRDGAAKNTVSIRTHNAEGWLRSAAFELEWKNNEKQSTAKGMGNHDEDPSLSEAEFVTPKLYVVAVGTSDYKGKNLDLNYADQDAVSMAKALDIVGTPLFEAGMKITCLTTDGDKEDAGFAVTDRVQWRSANKSNIEAALREVKAEAKAEDVLILYLSGHGKTYGDSEGAQFHYLTHGISDEDQLLRKDTRDAHSISSEELTEWINDIPALKQVLIIDACNSGQVVENLTGGTKNLNSSQIRALDRMKDRAGMFVISGSAADKVSYESSSFGQGLLTYSLLQGMIGEAVRKDAQGAYIDVMTLFNHAREQVPLLAQSIDGIQTPMLVYPPKGSIDIGLYQKEVFNLLAVEKPVVMRGIFQNEETLIDDLQLAGELEQLFRRETEKGKDANYIFVNVDDHPKGYILGGRYQRGTADISVELKLYKGTEFIQELAVKPQSSVSGLARRIASALKKALRQPMH